MQQRSQKLTANLFFEVLAIDSLLRMGQYNSIRYSSGYALNKALNHSHNTNSSTSRALKWLVDNDILYVNGDGLLSERSDKLRVLIHNTEWYDIIKNSQAILT